MSSGLLTLNIPNITGKIDYHCLMSGRFRTLLHTALALTLLLATTVTHAASTIAAPLDLRTLYQAQVDRRLDVPPAEQAYYAGQLTTALAQAGLGTLPPQYVVLVDRNPHVQAVFLYWLPAASAPELIGASPASTGRHGGFMYYETPTGVFEHTLANLDFRAEGTENAQGIMGYGIKGMRVYDFGWVPALRTWRAGEGLMRLQMHATDPRYLELRLGSVQSMGCIRIPATLNILLDRYGVLDADYLADETDGHALWMLRPDREPTDWPGRYLVIIDSGRDTRPDWSPNPLKKPRAGKARPTPVR